MHDNQLEDRLRQVLRAQGDSLRLTVTPAELRRQHALRERARSSRRVLIGAAAVLVVAAVAGSAALLLNRSDTPSVGTSPSPATSPSGAPSPSAASISPVADIARYAGYETLARLNGPDGNPVHTIVGDLPKQGDLLLVSGACSGIGIVTVTVSATDSLTVNCPALATEPARMVPYIADGIRYEIRVAASGDVRYQVLVESSELLLNHPDLVLRHGADEATMAQGCGGTISLGWGYDTSDSCATTVPSTPLETLAFATGDVATLSIDGWTFSFAGATCGHIKKEAASPDLYEAAADCTVTVNHSDSTISITGIPKGSEPWVLELGLVATNPGGDSFTGPFYALVDVR